MSTFNLKTMNILDFVYSQNETNRREKTILAVIGNID
jgi:hypothetical protein